MTEDHAFSTAVAFVQALGAAIGKHAPISLPRTTPPPSLPTPVPRSRLGAFAGIALLVLAVIGAGFGYYYGIHQPRQLDREKRTAAAGPGSTTSETQSAATGISPPAAENSQAARSKPVPPVVPAPSKVPATSEREPVLPATHPDAPKTGRILVNTVPSRATVYLDGRDNGSSPLALDDVPSGMHRLRIALDGYESAELMIEVAAARTSDTGPIHLVGRKAVAETLPPVRTETIRAPQPPPAPVNALDDETVRNLVRRELLSIEQNDLKTQTSCYATPVDYYDEGHLTAARLRSSLESFRRQWPLMDISELGFITVNGTTDPSTKTASFTYAFTARQPQTGKVSHGLVHEEVTVRNFGGRPLITRCRQTVTDRRKNY